MSITPYSVSTSLDKPCGCGTETTASNFGLPVLS